MKTHLRFAPPQSYRHLPSPRSPTHLRAQPQPPRRTHPPNTKPTPSASALPPRLSWKIRSTRAGETQTAFEIRAWRSDYRDTTGVAGGPVAALWSSGKIVSDQSVLVPWGGPMLGSATPVTWVVRTWDKNDQPSEWSERATLETGILNPAQEWSGKWITVDLPRYDIEEQPLAKAKWINGGSTATQGAGIPAHRGFARGCQSL